MGEHRRDELGGNFVTGLPREPAVSKTRGAMTSRPQLDVTEPALAGAMRHDLIVRALVLLPATVQTLDLLT
jgi:hypothetical protein